MRVALVTSVGTCGIAEHSEQLKQHVRAADAAIEFGVDAHWLDPAAGPEPYGWDIWHLNYHRGLHSRWTPDVIAAKVPPGDKVIITFHDTYDVQPDLLPWELLAVPQVKAMIVHEPCDLWHGYPIEAAHEYLYYREGAKTLQHRHKVHYWRQACPERDCTSGRPFNDRLDGWRPTLGTLGWDFPWKNYDLLAEVTGELGWNLRIVGDISLERRAQLEEKNPRLHCDGYVVSNRQALANLGLCDATAFLYTCANSGTSGAIRLGIAAGRPLIATRGCRQFRDLQAVDQAAGVANNWVHTGISWADPTAEGLAGFLRGAYMPCLHMPHGYHLPLVAFAHQESWPRLGAKYAALYQELLQS